jgi:hypothetical protein
MFIYFLFFFRQFISSSFSLFSFCSPTPSYSSSVSFSSFSSSRSLNPSYPAAGGGIKKELNDEEDKIEINSHMSSKTLLYCTSL